MKQEKKSKREKAEVTHSVVHPSTATGYGYLSPLLPIPKRISYLGVLWNEFLGTFFIALISRLFVAYFGGAAFASTIPTLFGSAIANTFSSFGALVMFGSISGGHFNPAVTLAIILIGLFTRLGAFGRYARNLEDESGNRHPWRTWLGLFPYVVVQFIAFILAALLIWGFLPAGMHPRSLPIALGMPMVSGVASNGKTFGVEIVGSFLYLAGYLLFLFRFGSEKHSSPQWERGAAVALYYFALIMAFSPWAGANWNPGLWLAFAIISGNWTNWWVLFLPPFISAVLASLFVIVHRSIGQTYNLFSGEPPTEEQERIRDEKLPSPDELLQLSGKRAVHFHPDVTKRKSKKGHVTSAILDSLGRYV